MGFIKGLGSGQSFLQLLKNLFEDRIGLFQDLQIVESQDQQTLPCKMFVPQLIPDLMFGI